MLFFQFVFALFFAVSIPSTVLYGVDNEFQLTQEYQGGKLYQKDKLKVLMLSGTYTEMGKQYGFLAKEDIKQFSQFQKDLQLFTHKKEDLHPNLKGMIATFAENCWQGYSNRQRQIFTGMAETSGMKVEDLILLDQNFLVHYMVHLFPGCSYFAAWDKYTEKNDLWLGRNLDWNPGYLKASPYLYVIVFNPTDGDHSIAIITYAGTVGALTGMNDQGLFLELNSGVNSFGAIFFENRKPYLNELTDFLFNVDSMNGLNQALYTTRAQYPSIVNIADDKTSYSYENAPYDVRRRTADDCGEEGLLISTNHMLHETWGVNRMESPTESLRRYKNLLSLTKQYKGKINLQTMKEIMDIPMTTQDGKPADGVLSLYKMPRNPDITVYQVIGHPKSRTMWIKSPTYSDWTEISFNQFFQKK